MLLTVDREISFAHGFVRRVCVIQRKFFSVFCCFFLHSVGEMETEREQHPPACLYLLSSVSSYRFIHQYLKNHICCRWRNECNSTHASRVRKHHCEGMKSLAGAAYSLCLFISGRDVFPEGSPSDSYCM